MPKDLNTAEMATETVIKNLIKLTGTFKIKIEINNTLRWKINRLFSPINYDTEWALWVTDLDSLLKEKETTKEDVKELIERLEILKSKIVT